MSIDDNLFIFNTINHKYSNYIVPKLPNLICTYLLQYPEKHDLYLSSNVDVEELLKYIIETRKHEKIKLSEIIINYVEVICNNI